MRCNLARHLAFVVVLLASVATAREALAINACTAAQISANDSSCPTGTGPCTISKNFTIVGNCTLDFGTRAVTVTGTIDFLSNTITITAGTFTVAAGGKLTGLGDVSSAPRNKGGHVTIQTTGAVNVNNATTPGQIDVSANLTAGDITIVAGGTVTIAGRLRARDLDPNADGGTIDIKSAVSIVTQSTALIDATGGELAYGGSIYFTANGGNVDLGALVDLRGGEGGYLEVTAAGAAVIRDVDLSATGDEGTGGDVEVDARSVQLLGTLLSQGSPPVTGGVDGGGDGGDITIVAEFGDIVIGGDIFADGAGSYGSGTSIDLEAYVGNITQQLSADLSSKGPGSFGFGGDIYIEVGLSFTGNGLIDASGGDQGGDITVFAARDITLNKRLDASGLNPGSSGGFVDIEAGFEGKGAIMVVDRIDGRGGLCTLERGCGFGGSILLDGCDVTVGVAAQLLTTAATGGEVDITSREQLRVQGAIDSRTGATPGVNGVNTFMFRIGKTPIVSGTVSPPPLNVPRATCTPTLTTGCLTPCPTCGNGIVEYPETCDNNNGTPVNCDGCSAFCKVETTCSDNNVCTTDSCDPTFGCKHTPLAENTACNDGDVCNGPDVCKGDPLYRACVRSSTTFTLDCNDNNLCTTDSCNRATGCVHANNNVPCNDGLFCNGTEACSAGSCAHSGNPCTGPDGDGNCAESCNEATDSCTAPDPNGSSCNDGLFCNGADTCNAGTCAVHSGNPCPGPDGDGNCAESCDEATDGCTAPDPNGSACTDGLFCTGADSCSGGTCAVHAGNPCPGPDGDANCAESCNEAADNCTAADADGSVCPGGICAVGVCSGSTTTTSTSTTTTILTTSTTNTSTSSTTTTSISSTTSTTIPGRCGSAPASGCLRGTRASFQLKDATDEKDQIKWSLKGGDAFDQVALGDPATNRVYSLCIYDETAGVPSLVATLTIDPNPNWSNKAPKGFIYRDKAGSEDGVQKAILKTGLAGKTAVKVSAKGTNIPMPAPHSATEFFDLDTAVTVQLVNDQTPTCWTTEFTGAKRNMVEQFRATTP